MSSDNGNGEGSAVIFDIERYATEDGPGIRTVVFFKGCNLRCAWCQNPESQSPRPQVLYDQSRCVGCRRCVSACPSDAVREVAGLGFISEAVACTLCGACIDACLAGARRVVGQRMTLGAIMEAVDRDAAYYAESGGGVTFSGGEPLLQDGALRSLARQCRTRGYHIAVETAGNAPWSAFEGLLPWVDLLYFDLKHVDSEAHRRHTASSPERILANLDRASRSAVELVVRIPVIPGVNADETTLGAMLRYIAERTRARRVELLPFHRLGLGKYKGLGMPYAMAAVENMSREQCTPFVVIGESLGLQVHVGV